MDAYSELHHTSSPDDLGLISEAGLHVSEKRYWKKYYNHPDFSYEWNNGVLEVRPASNLLQYMLYDWFVMCLYLFRETHPIASTMGLGMGFRLMAAGHLSVRKPDLLVVRHDNPVALQDLDERYNGVCDVCIESLSTATIQEIERDTKVKKQEYAAVGVREYFILDASAVYTAFYYLTPEGNYAEMKPDRQGVIRSSVLPGFQFRISDLYLRPSLAALVKDEVYRGFVFPEYQTEKQRAEQEHIRAERLAAPLRELGVKPEDIP